jgi:hypothetical protein
MGMRACNKRELSMKPECRCGPRPVRRNRSPRAEPHLTVPQLRIWTIARKGLAPGRQQGGLSDPQMHTADIYSHASRGKDHAAALCWDNIMQEACNEKSTGVN